MGTQLSPSKLQLACEQALRPLCECTSCVSESGLDYILSLLELWKQVQIDGRLRSFFTNPHDGDDWNKGFDAVRTSVQRISDDTTCCAKIAEYPYAFGRLGLLQTYLKHQSAQVRIASIRAHSDLNGTAEDSHFPKFAHIWRSDA